MQDKKRKRIPMHAAIFSDEMENVASMQEATGMIPTPPQSDDEAENYASLYDLPPEQDIRNK